MMPQRKAPAVFQHDGLYDLIALVFVHTTSFASVDKGIHNKTTKYGLPTY